MLYNVAMKILIITNNPQANIAFSDKYDVEFYPDKDQEEILCMARDRVHLGAKLLIHPMMGRIKPHETPYKSVLLDLDSVNTHIESVMMIEDSIAITHKDLNNTVYKKYFDEILEDLQFMDRLLLESGIEELRR